MAYQERWIKYFELLDSDGSGAIDPADLEYATVLVETLYNKPSEAEDVQLGISGYTNLDFDLDGDGQISKDELLKGVDTYFARKSIETMPDWWRHYSKQIFDGADSNRNGELSLEEVTTMLKRVDSSLSEADVAEAYQWACKRSSKGKFDAKVFSEILYIWATSPDDTKEVNILCAFLRNP